MRITSRDLPKTVDSAASSCSRNSADPAPVRGSWNHHAQLRRLAGVSQALECEGVCRPDCELAPGRRRCCEHRFTQFGGVVLRRGDQSKYSDAAAVLVAGYRGTEKGRLMENSSNSGGHALDEEGDGVGGSKQSLGTYAHDMRGPEEGVVINGTYSCTSTLRNASAEHTQGRMECTKCALNPTPPCDHEGLRARLWKPAAGSWSCTAVR